MSGKRIKAVVAAILIAFALAASASPAITHSVVFAEECGTTTGGCN